MIPVRLSPTALILGALLAIGTLPLFVHSEPASAMTLRLAPVKDASRSAENGLPFEKVGRRGGGRPGYGRGGGRHYKYHRGRHGPRYRHRRGRHRHYHGGYWYAFPWWLGIGIYAAPYYGPYYAPRRPRYSGSSCSYWAGRCDANWSRPNDYRGCMRYHGCL